MTTFEVIAGLRETTYDHLLLSKCWCDGTNCPPQYRTYEHVPHLDRYLIDGQEVTREVFEAEYERAMGSKSGDSAPRP